MMQPEISDLKHALKATFEGLDAAGYALDVSVAGAELQMTVSAMDGACPECLVPKPLFLQMVKDELKEGGISFSAISVRYPKDIK
ncbi:hypothetical protein [Sinorhizobium meliloti]|uniref:hypothetical protein n=1 Tax=Rhizobium meliloti TaxID=382 RepID=UPI003F17E55A